MLALLVALVLPVHAFGHPGSGPDGWPKADCLSGYGKTACGYDCTSGYGDVKCAQTPFGKCASGYGVVACNDPSKRVIREAGGRPAQMQCTSGYGKVVCGYQCVSGYGDVQCAASPRGRCEAAYGKVTCWDPNDRDDDAHGHRGPPPDEKAECLSRYGKTECGYGCVAAYGEIKCAKRPNGTCTAAYGEITCSE